MVGTCPPRCPDTDVRDTVIRDIVVRDIVVRDIVVRDIVVRDTDVEHTDAEDAMALRTSPIHTTVASCCGTLSVTLDEEQAVQLAQLFAALADPVRLRLLSMIASQGEVCSCELQGPLGKSQPTVSHHTKALAEAGLIVGEKRGRWMWWRVVPERFAALRAALL
jgi:ArsR family transcriptional regulator, arsenate/arsenite/antimonite-responsive transcriptional repressor